MSHKVFAEILATKFREVQSCTDEDGSVASGGPSLSTTLKSLAIPIGAEWLSLTPRNFADGAGTMRFALAPRLTIIVTTDGLATGAQIGKSEPTDIATRPTQDISDEMQDGDQEDFAIDSIDTIANLDSIYIGGPLPFRGATVDIGTGANATGSRVLTVKYWDGGAWTSASATDNTKSGTASMAIDGTVTWAVPAKWTKETLLTIGDTSIEETWSRTKLYWTRWEWNGALDSDTDVRQIKALSRSTNYAELLEGQALELSINPQDVATLEVLTNAGTGNVIANAGVLGSNIVGKPLKKFRVI
ncbi:hypothetical protein LCGC14_1923140 [marine sediment metagenome]|uniref:Uncharacterized protein n=1 Tax=marine sediment metagenome TaxID=412755 RepID=A0A0F9I437_9ZZZZ